MSKMPKQKPGSSKQGYETPPEFIKAVERRFGKIHVDLAATDRSCSRGCHFISPEQDSLSDAVDWMDWGLIDISDKRHRCAWLNPPFADLEPWMMKALAYSNEAREKKLWAMPLVMLTPASIGTNWFANVVHGNALVLGLSPRITFVGETQGYPKDLMLTVWNCGVRGFDCWRWDR